MDNPRVKYLSSLWLEYDTPSETVYIIDFLISMILTNIEKMTRRLRKYTLEEVVLITNQLGIVCLDKQYINNKTTMKWRCLRCDNIWNSSFKKINIQGHYCPLCAGVIRHTITEAQQVAENKGGKCLSLVYTNNSTPLEWKCGEYIWKACYKAVNRGTWCPVCRSSYGEKAIARYLDEKR